MGARRSSIYSTEEKKLDPSTLRPARRQHPRRPTRSRTATHPVTTEAAATAAALRHRRARTRSLATIHHRRVQGPTLPIRSPTRDRDYLRIAAGAVPELRALPATVHGERAEDTADEAERGGETGCGRRGGDEGREDNRGLIRQE